MASTLRKKPHQTGGGVDRESRICDWGARPRPDSEAAKNRPAPLPSSLWCQDPVRLGPWAHPSLTVLKKAHRYLAARDRLTYLKQAYKKMLALLSLHDWSLLTWSNRCLVQLAAEEGLGPASLDKDARNSELRRLLHKRQLAWRIASSAVLEWEGAWAEYRILTPAYEDLWPDRWTGWCVELASEASPEFHRRSHVKAAAGVSLWIPEPAAGGLEVDFASLAASPERDDPGQDLVMILRVPIMVDIRLWVACVQ
ncbi:hypothetical protein WJX84_004488 [Apatococcus fuscideae]|uniref:Uncharacterized protein n=1 Tax=Apatococcus fuscideae TaxID=2026836 RepID=A0AAW1T3T5_9CHLO